MLDQIPVATAAGDAGMLTIMTAGEPGHSSAALADLMTRIPAITAALH